MLQTRSLGLVLLLLISMLVGCARPAPQVDAPTATDLPIARKAASLPPEAFPTARPPESPSPAAQAMPATQAASPVATVDSPREQGPTAPATNPTLERSLDPGLAASVNGMPITREDYEQQLEQAQRFLLQQPDLSANEGAGERALAELKMQVLNWQIDRMLIEQAAAQAGLVISDASVQDQIGRMRGGDSKRFDEWLSANGMTLAELENQLRADLLTAAIRDRVTATVSRASEHIHVRHILLSEQATAHHVESSLRSGENFIALARQYSEDQATRGSGGDLGFLPRGVMPPEFDQIAFDLAPGEISDLVESPSGYQIIQVVEIDPLRSVSDQHWPMVQQRAFEEWLATQRTAADIVSIQP